MGRNRSKNNVLAENFPDQIKDYKKELTKLNLTKKVLSNKLKKGFVRKTLDPNKGESYQKFRERAKQITKNQKEEIKEMKNLIIKK